MGMGEFNSADHCVYCCRQEFLQRNEIALVNKSSEKQYLGAISKEGQMLKNVQTTVQLHSFHMLTSLCSNTFKLDFSNL